VQLDAFQGWLFLFQDSSPSQTEKNKKQEEKPKVQKRQQ
jgi:hypothetical protein